MSSILKLVGAKVRDIRKQKGWSQELLGEKAGLHFSYIGGLERGEKNITLLNLEKVAVALDVQIHNFFSYSKDLKGFDNDTLVNETLELLLKLNKSDLKKVNTIIKEFI
ncbi:helix-turn-helix domain-containing protein [Paenibacillus sp. GCM10028914]|uniref:helix-turn-helix domain-containing protein n=1 Tax=Paenibacillus sp. GCM10028914 TaxID=3273416 RepID=UPI0036180AA1